MTSDMCTHGQEQNLSGFHNRCQIRIKLLQFSLLIQWKSAALGLEFTELSLLIFLTMNCLKKNEFSFSLKALIIYIFKTKNMYNHIYMYNVYPKPRR